ncbi:hypothetical protein DL93DRAFT_1598918 [Clavulina sp. PMI_390]|nr:hypothetical protein DL93DRAFT_1598918 [Clavulina sp. PMI_390]
MRNPMSKRRGSLRWGKPELPSGEDGALLPWAGCDLDSFEVPINRDFSRLAEHTSSAFPFPQPPFLLHDDNGDDNIFTNWSKCDPYCDRDNGKPYDAPFISEAYVTLPSFNVTNFYLFARGANAQGRVKYIQNPNVDRPTVSVKLYYWHPEMRNSVMVCMLAHNDTSQGVGIFTPDKRWDWMPTKQRDVSFDILVVLPGGNYRKVDQLHSNVPKFNQLLYHLDSGLDVVDVRATDGHVAIEGELHAKVINIITTSGAIKGDFWIDGSLRLETMNSNIDAEIQMINKRSTPTTAVLKSSNGSITVVWRLSSLENRTSPTYPGHHGHFTINATTSNAPVYHTFKYAPINPDVIFDTQTSNSLALVALWRTMESPFEMSGLNGFIDSHLTSNDDPMHLGREPVYKVLAVTPYKLQGYFDWRQPPPTIDTSLDTGSKITDGGAGEQSTGLTISKSCTRIIAENGYPMLSFV